MELEDKIIAFCQQRAAAPKWKMDGDAPTIANELQLFYKVACAERGCKYDPTSETKKNIAAVGRFLTDRTTKPSLLMTGTVGNGKTTMLRSVLRLIQYHHGNAIETRYIKASALGDLMKDDSEGFKRLKSAKLLFIDDMGFYGKEQKHNYGDILYPVEEIIEYRYDKILPIIATSNLNGRNIKELYGERIYSRMCESFEMVAFEGADFRTKKGVL